MMKIKASVDLKCEPKSVDECQAGMSLFTLCQCSIESAKLRHIQFCIGDASLNELPIEHRVWHRSVVSGRLGGA